MFNLTPMVVSRSGLTCVQLDPLGTVSRSGLTCVPLYPLGSVSEARHQGFSLGTLVSSPPSLVNGSANKINLKKCDLSSVKLES